MENKIYLKNMVCDRCKLVVKDRLEKNGIGYKNIELGEIELSGQPTEEQLRKFSADVNELGFEIIEDKTARLVSAVKTAVLEFVRDPSPSARKLKFSTYLSDKLNKDYNYISNLFSALEGTTIEQYLIHQKIERVKELLVYDELNLSEVAHQLGYSSVQHLSNQFKKVTGLTPSHFKQLGDKKRTALDKI
ncbi:MAG TPA: AraC family transcriptional regulator [Chryseosolibacter sp.]